MHISAFGFSSRLDITSAYIGASDSFAHGWTHRKTVPEAVLAHVIKGRYEISTPNAHATIEPGELFLVAANTPVTIAHFHDSTGVMSSQWIHFHCLFARSHELTSLLDMPLHVTGVNAERSGEALSELRSLMAPPTKGTLSPMRAIIRSSLRVREILYRLLGEVCEISTLRSSSEAILGHSERMAPVLEHIFHCQRDAIRVEDLAAKACLSPSHFHSLFREQFGVSPLEYVRRRRIDEACRLLVNTELSVTLIADQTGFSTPYHFSRVFRSLRGIPPTAYRKANSLLRW